jgi:iron-sulfur cluster assembly protein
MLQEVELRTITVTAEAAKAINDIVTDRKLEGYALRVYLAGSGCCSGVNFGMALDNNVREVDRTFDSGGVRIVVDEVSMDYLQGAKIDVVNDRNRGAGFIVDTPSAQAHKHGHGEEACACGGSCDCKN